MLPKKRRITKLAFKKVLERSAYSASPFFSIRWRREEGAMASTFAVVISKKIMASAVNRNKLKRRCYHVLRDLIPKIKNSYKIVFFMKKGVEKLSFTELSENIYSALSKNNLIS